jgi:DNA-binding MarR family transcriptional regulator
MELHDLRYFVAVAEDLHFGRAAARLHITQPALTRQIQALEAELNVRLFDRTQRRVQLTLAGQTFYSEAKQILNQTERAVQMTQRVARGENRLWQYYPVTIHLQRRVGLRLKTWSERTLFCTHVMKAHIHTIGLFFSASSQGFIQTLCRKRCPIKLESD